MRRPNAVVATEPRPQLTWGLTVGGVGQNRSLHNHRLASSFAALRQPTGQAFCKALWREAKTGFDFAVGDGQRIVKLRSVGEVAHAELVQPFERAGAPLAANHYLHRKFLRVHFTELTIARRQQGAPSNC